MKQFKNHTLKEYLDCLAQKTAVPGGGSAAALTAALGAGLLCMVARYSLGKSADPQVEAQIKKFIQAGEKTRGRLLELVDLDAKAYLEVTQTRKSNPEKYKAALKKAREVPLEVCRLCCQSVETAPLLVECGNKHLIADVAVACELLLSAFNGALTLSKYN